jgi:primosomal protein N' (replication factor Y)
LSSSLKAKIIIPGNLPQPFWYEAGHLNPDSIGPGILVKVPLLSKTVTGLVVETKTTSFSFKTREIIEITRNDKFDSQWIQMLQWISTYYHAPLSKVLHTALSKLSLRIIEKQKEQENKPQPRASHTGRSEHFPALTSEQSKVVDEISRFMSPDKEGVFKSFLLHGTAGDTMTPLYLHLAGKCLESGKNVLVLLPEIVLTPQTVETFKKYMACRVYTLHSSLKTGERREFWNAVLERRIRLLIGVRSAALCPIDNLGLIIVDDEHDISYKKSEGQLRYNSRDVALYRGRQYNCPVVLGSTTPSMESYYAAHNGKHELIRIKSETGKRPPPRIHVIDMREQFELQGDLPLSIPLRDTLTTSLKKGEQVILLLNRLGFARRRICKDCGNTLVCPACRAPLIYHRNLNRLKCHYCSHTEPKAFTCSSCHGKEYLDTGMAIEKLEVYLKKIYPGTGILRLDSESTAKPGSQNEIFHDFEEGKAQILLGTQMLTKGHDFISAGLVGIIDADIGMGLPDFRAQERIFQVITRISGRAGRRHKPGEVFIQTFRPENPAFQFIIENNYQKFYEAELKLRNELGYPPANRLFKLEISGRNERSVFMQMEKFAEVLKKIAVPAQISILGPEYPPLKIINGKYRSHVFGKGKSTHKLQWALSQCLEGFSTGTKSKFRIQVDMDPVLVT